MHRALQNIQKKEKQSEETQQTKTQRTHPTTPTALYIAIHPRGTHRSSWQLCTHDVHVHVRTCTYHIQCRAKYFTAHNFHGLVTSNIWWKHIFADQKFPVAYITYWKQKCKNMCLKNLVSHSICTQIYYILTFFSLLHLKSEVESSDGEVDRLWVGLADGAEEVEDVVALLPHQAGEQLRYPR